MESIISKLEISNKTNSENNKTIIETIVNENIILLEMVNSINESNLYKEVDFGQSEGKEIW